MADFKIKNGEQVRQVTAEKESATVIEAGDLVALDSGYIIKAVAASTAVAFSRNGAAAGVTEIDVTIGNDFTLEGTTDANFAITDRGILCDLAGTTTLLIDIGTSSTDVLKVGIAESSGTVDAKTSVEVQINKPIF